MEERSNKTVMCSVLFLDIVEYSRMPVSGQISLKDRFNSYLSAAISDMPVADRIILDTGDGAAINFLGDVEDALKTALRLRESILSKDSDMNPPLMVRAGINLGPVRLVRDINGQPNIVGDGINVAQRIMAFADVGQILVSRSYHDAVSRLSSQYAEIFNYQGSRTDKHVREHEVYAVGHLGEGTVELIVTHVRKVQKSGVLERFLEAVREGWNAVILWPNSIIKNLGSRFELADRRQRVIYAGAIAVLMMLIVVLVLTLDDRDEMTAPSNAALLSAASSVESAILVAPAIPVAPVAEGKTAETSRAQPVIASKPDTKEITERKQTPEKLTGSTVDSKKTKGSLQGDQLKQVDTQRKDTVVESAGKNNWLSGILSGNAEFRTHVVVSCRPGTQVFVDGVAKGKITSGVLVTDVSPGKHTVIVTSKKGEVYSQEIELAEGKAMNIRPGFCD